MIVYTPSVAGRLKGYTIFTHEKIYNLYTESFISR
jgi:hypothetical protein